MKTKTVKIALEGFGSYLGRGEGCFEVRDKNGRVERYPHFQKEIGEAVLKSGSYVSVDALIDLALWNVDTLIMTRKNRVVAFSSFLSARYSKSRFRKLSFRVLPHFPFFYIIMLRHNS